jgi:hypothetical protein
MSEIGRLPALTGRLIPGPGAVGLLWIRAAQQQGCLHLSHSTCPAVNSILVVYSIPGEPHLARGMHRRASATTMQMAIQDTIGTTKARVAVSVAGSRLTPANISTTANPARPATRHMFRSPKKRGENTPRSAQKSKPVPTRKMKVLAIDIAHQISRLGQSIARGEHGGAPSPKRPRRLLVMTLVSLPVSRLLRRRVQTKRPRRL